MSFVHLHVHTEYSLLDGALKIKGLGGIVKEKNMDAIAITDHGSMHGVVDFYKECLKEGVKPIIGCEVYVAENSRFDKGKFIDDKRYHLLLICENNQGYKNLCKIVSKSYLEGFYYKPRVDMELLEEYKDGIIALSACLAGEIPRAILDQDFEKGIEIAKGYKKIFGATNFFIELQDHNLSEDKILMPKLIEISEELDIPVVATNDVHYLAREDSYAHEVLMCIQMATTLDDPHRFEFPNDEFYLKSPDEMEEIFKFIPEAISNTELIAKRCNVEISFHQDLLPDYKVPKGYNLISYLREICDNGVRIKYRSMTPKIEERLNYELSVIEKMGFPGYFLIVWDMIKFAKENGIFVGPGRGSAAGSIVAYVMDITTIDPLKYDLLFERFLNPGRISLPDIDTDFCYKRRGEVIEYLISKYGHDRVAQIVTFGTMAARAVVRDVGRVLGISLRDVDKVAKLIPDELKITLKKALIISNELRNLYESDNQIKKLIDIGKSLEGMPRHASLHAAAVVIAPDSIDEFLPIKIEGETALTTQYSMSVVEELGLLKMDLLGLRTLTVIGDTINEIKRNSGIEINLSKLQLDDCETFDLLGSGETSGLFQLESKGMQKIIKSLKPDSFKDIIALVALYRPGPIGSGMIDDFIKRKHGEIEIKYPHPLLESVLKDTYGVILYQEQVMKIASVMGNFTMSEGDNLRKAMGKKSPEILERSRQQFIEGCRKKGIGEEKGEEVFKLIEYFGGYGFNKSHSAAYAMIAYETAYLKTHFSVEFMASLMSSVLGSSDKIIKYMAECRRLNITILPPDINESLYDFTVSNGFIRCGFGAIKNVGEGAIARIIKGRDEGPMETLEDFLNRIDSKVLSKKVMENLILVGALDSLGINRRTLFLNLEDIILRGHSLINEKDSPQISFFEIDENLNQERLFDLNLIKKDEFSKNEILKMEKNIVGFYISGNPLDQYNEIFKSFDFKDISEIEERDDNSKIFFKGIISNIKIKKTKNNEEYFTMDFENEVGILEGIIFPYNLNQIGRENIQEGNVVIGRGKLQVTERVKKIIVESIVDPGKGNEFYKNFKKRITAIKILVKDNKSEEEIECIKNEAFMYRGKIKMYVEHRGKTYRMNFNVCEKVISVMKKYGEVIEK